MQVKATHRYLRMSPQKVRLVLPAVRGQRPDEAVAYLRLMPQAAAMPVAKVIKSAAANAENNFALDPSKLIITKATADVGPTMKRFMAAARGRAATIHRRTTHVTVVIEDSAVVAPKDSVAARLAKAMPKRTPKKADKPAAEEDKKSAEETKKQVSKTPVKKASKASRVPKVATRKTPETNDAGAEANPRRTNQQTGRGATTKANQKSTSTTGKDKS